MPSKNVASWRFRLHEPGANASSKHPGIVRVERVGRKKIIMTDLRFGVIGWGYWGPKIARNLDSLPHTSVSMIADLDAKRLHSVRIHQPSIRTATDPDE